MPRFGTCTFTAPGWERAFYPPKLHKQDRLAFYATRFDTLEIDSTFYAIPPLHTVRGWREQTPEEFVFALKIPQEITHQHRLADVSADVLRRFVGIVREGLAEKLGPMLFQFPYFRREELVAESFLERLRAFLPVVDELRLRHGALRFALEVRNAGWVNEALCGLLREHRVALTLVDHPYMLRGPLERLPFDQEHPAGVPRLQVRDPTRLWRSLDPVTADFTYVRLIGDRHAIEKLTTTWDSTVVDRRPELLRWADLLAHLERRGVPAYVYVNNHYAGYAPETIALLREDMGLPAVEPRPFAPRAQGATTAAGTPRQPPRSASKRHPLQGSLFDDLEQPEDRPSTRRPA